MAHRILDQYSRLKVPTTLPAQAPSEPDLSDHEIVTTPATIIRPTINILAPAHLATAWLIAITASIAIIACMHMPTVSWAGFWHAFLGLPFSTSSWTGIWACTVVGLWLIHGIAVVQTLPHTHHYRRKISPLTEMVYIALIDLSAATLLYGCGHMVFGFLNL